MDIETHVHKKTSTQMFTAALLITVKTGHNFNSHQQVSAWTGECGMLMSRILVSDKKEWTTGKHIPTCTNIKKH